MLRLNTLMDYAYMLFKPGVSQRGVPRRLRTGPWGSAVSPDHEHSTPDIKGDVKAPSSLYGNPLFDLKRLRDVEAVLRTK